jgi:hypothetical protein
MSAGSAAGGHTCRPVYRGLARIAATVRNFHAAPVRCGVRAGSAADGHGTPASFGARVILAALCLAGRCANIVAPILASLKEVQGAGPAQ